MSVPLDRIYKKIEEMYGPNGSKKALEGDPKIDFSLIKEITRSQFGFFKEAVDNNKGYGLRLQYLGIFGITTGRTLFLEKLKQEYNGELPSVNTHERNKRQQQKDSLL